MSDQLTEVLQFANSKLGDPYVYGGSGPNSFDCSGLVWAAYKAAGINVPRTAEQLGATGKPVALADAKPGMVVYFQHHAAGAPGDDHVGIYLGNGQMIDAPDVGQSVKVEPVAGFTSIRDLGAAGSPSAWDAITNPVGTATDAIAGVFAGWQTDLFGVGVKLAAAVIVGGLVVVGTWTALHERGAGS